MKNNPACCAPDNANKPWFRRNALLAATGFLIFLGVCQLVPVLHEAGSRAQDYLEKMGWAMGLGLLLGGALDLWIPKEYVSAVLAGRRKRSIFYATAFGFAMSVCSHGLLAIAIELHRKGASTPVVVSFLLASPWANLPITLLLFSFFGMKALFVIVGALFVAVTTGLLFRRLEAAGWVEINPHTASVPESFSVSADLKRRFSAVRLSPGSFFRSVPRILRSSLGLADSVLAWVVFGVVLSSLAGAFIPAGFFHRYMGPSFLGLFVTLGLATVIEVCSEGMAPLAFEIFKQTGAFGNAFVFLLAGVATDYTEIGLLWSNVGRRAAMWLPAVAVPQILILGMIANSLFRS